MDSTRSIVVVGAGAFGISAAIELRRRGHDLIVVDRGSLPHVEASSTDISKAVRMDYGSDEFYTELAQLAIERWHVWNREWDEPLYHQDGFLLMTPRPLAAGGFEADCLGVLERLGHPVERVDAADIARRFPAWNAELYVDGYINLECGWAESGKVIDRLVRQAIAGGIRVDGGAGVAGLVERGDAVIGVTTRDGREILADTVILAAGAWTPTLLPELSDFMWATGQPVLHFAPQDPEPFRAERFPVWGADIHNTGWYGFPVQHDGVLKVAHHGPGQRMHPEDPKLVPRSEEARFREFLARSLPPSADAPLVASRLCMYCDTWDGDFWIDHHPEREGLVVACGGSGHGFKFVPVLGEIIADVVERRPNRWASRFAWRTHRRRAWEQSRQQ